MLDLLVTVICVSDFPKMLKVALKHRPLRQVNQLSRPSAQGRNSFVTLAFRSGSTFGFPSLRLWFQRLNWQPDPVPQTQRQPKILRENISPLDQVRSHFACLLRLGFPARFP